MLKDGTPRAVRPVLAEKAQVKFITLLYTLCFYTSSSVSNTISLTNLFVLLGKNTFSH